MVPIFGNLCEFKMVCTFFRYVQLGEYDKWYAYYDKEFYFPYKINIWQYSENGSVDGITGNVDMNISFKDYE